MSLRWGGYEPGEQHDNGSAAALPVDLPEAREGMLNMTSFMQDFQRKHRGYHIIYFHEMEMWAWVLIVFFIGVIVGGSVGILAVTRL